jgi:hypothetical protein
VNQQLISRLNGATHGKLLIQLGVMALAGILAVPALAQECTPNANTGVTVNESESNENNKSIHSGNGGSQTFTATGEGCFKLSAVTFSVRREGTPGANLTVQIRATSGGLPSTTPADILASVSGVVVTSTTFTDVTVNFDPQPEIAGGAQYALVVYGGGGNANAGYRLGLDDGNPYAGGKYCKVTDSGATIDNCFGDDLDVRMSICVTPCESGCVQSQGFWKNHEESWPVGSLMLGATSYTQVDLLSILNTPVGGNGLISLSYQLIAAKLNAENGAPVPAGIAAAIAAADTLIGALVVPPVGSDSLAPASTSALTGTLDQYNNGLYEGGPPHCVEGGI